MELVSLADKLTDIIWMRYFVEYLGYDMDHHVVYQDNMRVLSLEKNGRVSYPSVPSILRPNIFSLKIIMMLAKLTLNFAPQTRCGWMY